MLFKLTFRENNLRFVSLRIQRNLQLTQCSGSSANIFFDEKGVASISSSSPPYPSRSSVHIFFDEKRVASLSSSSPPYPSESSARIFFDEKGVASISSSSAPHPPIHRKKTSSKASFLRSFFDEKGETSLIRQKRGKSFAVSLEIALLKQNIYPHM
ncbi:hypothetical protein MRB53_032755 [Persea americana]|uniref:Uncharacterized protein n=2 Tax=Persea americana TaxID=3435 RepID=A0ACC2KTC7_PERAE|nr:hypothetical protein MRB53_032748 [Persea americana]KAJ8624225.1 hypothetical protein MRB53_032755 [Persea americana]